jgi:hypothetical protein
VEQRRRFRFRVKHQAGETIGLHEPAEGVAEMVGLERQQSRRFGPAEGTEGDDWRFQPRLARNAVPAGQGEQRRIVQRNEFALALRQTDYRDGPRQTGLNGLAIPEHENETDVHHEHE